MAYYDTPYMQPYGYNSYLPHQFPPQQQMQQAPTQPAQPALNGKVVDSEDVVRVTEVPMGSFGIFPKGDLSEIYLKSWSNNGTTQIICFRPVNKIEEKSQNDLMLEQISQNLNDLMLKVDKLTFDTIAAVGSNSSTQTARKGGSRT